MAEVTGFTCDVCAEFGTSQTHDRKDMPLGWMRVTVQTTYDHRDNTFHICSNKCLGRLAKNRQKAEDEVSPTTGESVTSSGRNVSDEGRIQMRRSGLSLAHRRGAHDKSPNEDCPICEEETAAS